MSIDSGQHKFVTYRVNIKAPQSPVPDSVGLHCLKYADKAIICRKYKAVKDFSYVYTYAT